MAQALSKLPAIADPNLIVGLNTADDAGVYKISNELALVYTVDLLAPVVEDPYLFGMISATNCISDIYAMGGEPKLGLNVVGFPGAGDPSILGEILKGGQAKAQEAGVTICGGHTFNSEGIMYGLSVIGYINPKRIITNANARPGDVIILTKPIGVGTIIQATLLDRAEGLDLKIVYEGMTTLNKNASMVMQEIGVDAATDITGYGLVGHLVEMAEASNVGIELWASRIPIYPGAIDLIKSGIIEPGIQMNIKSFSEKVEKRDIPSEIYNLIFGSETSGGLAIVLPEGKVNLFLQRYQRSARVIGKVTKEHPGKLVII
uniref:Selenide, water dikinase SelD n=1 Tax=candidate division WOR-3 bacterium TaxID=2052148 RepID=A0A7C4XME4_UNCW3